MLSRILKSNAMAIQMVCVFCASWWTTRHCGMGGDSLDYLFLVEPASSWVHCIVQNLVLTILHILIVHCWQECTDLGKHLNIFLLLAYLPQYIHLPYPVVMGLFLHGMNLTFLSYLGRSPFLLLFLTSNNTFIYLIRLWCVFFCMEWILPSFHIWDVVPSCCCSFLHSSPFRRQWRVSVLLWKFCKRRTEVALKKLGVYHDVVT